MKSEKWQNPYEVEKIINERHPHSTLNMRAVTKCIKDNQWYTEDILDKRRQKDSAAELERQRLLRLEEEYRQSLNRITKNEHSKLV